MIMRAIVPVGFALVAAACAATPDRVLRVCADPNNLPFSNERLEGFENRIAEIIAADLDARVEYTWFAQRRGFIRNTLGAGECDLVLGVPSSFDLALTTRPYYRSTYVFVDRTDSGHTIESLDDPALRELRVGVQLIGDDYTNSPPAHALANRGIIDNIVGYSVIGDYTQESPPARILDAVAAGHVDVAVVWGPLAGWYTQQNDLPLDLVPVQPQIDLPFLPFVFDIAMAVRREDVAFKEELDEVLRRRQPEITQVLNEYGVPMLGRTATGRAAP